MKSRIKNLEKGFLMKYIIATFCLILIFAITIAHSMYMNQKLSDISKTYLSKITAQNAEVLSRQIYGNLESLNVLARMISIQENFKMDEIMNIIYNESKSGDFISLGVKMKDGSFGFTPIPGDGRDGGRLLMPADLGYINNIMAGYASLSESPASRQVNDETVNIYVRPVYRNLEINGVLVAFFNNEFFDDLLLLDTFENEGCSYIAEKDGSVIFHQQVSKHDNEFSDTIQALSSDWSLEGEIGAELKKEIAGGSKGTIEYSQGKESLYISYAPIGFHDWYLINITDASVAEAKSQGIYDDIIPAFIYILILLMTLILYFIYIRNEGYKRLERKIRLQSINDESYRMIMEQTNDIIFEYDTLEKTYLHTENFKKTFGYEPTKTGFMGSLEYDYLHPDDVIRFVEINEKMKENRGLSEAEVRIINSEGEYLWSRIYTLGIYDKDGRLAKIIGKIVNIDEKKKELQRLTEMAVMDAATGVYNKKTTEDMIAAYLKGEGRFGRHALLIIDIDNFKGINDDHGHRLGDTVISALGAELNQIFRASDIKGRIGGDEFMILIKDVEGNELIVNKANTICQIFKEREVDENKKVEVSTSIGIALYDRDGTTYEELYEAADKALYNCKSIQKGTFAFCDDR